MTAVLLVVGSFIVMEPVTYLTHRFVMHGAGMVLHRSHHRRWPRRRPGDGFLEANDGFPVIFAAVVLVALAAGFNVDGLADIVPVCIGVTLYGAVYALVHDGYIHGRIPVPLRTRWLDHLADAHALHHRFGGEPYGMLAPVVPDALRAKARLADERRQAKAVGDASAASPERAAAAPRP